MGWVGPWNVGEDDMIAPNFAMQQAGMPALAQGFGFNPNAMNPKLAMNNMLVPQPNMGLQMAPQVVPPPPQMSPEQAQKFCAQYPAHPWAMMLARQLQQLAMGGLGVRMAVDGMFSPEQFYRSLPTKTRMEPLPLGSSGVIAGGGTFTFTAIVQKPFKGTKLTFAGDTGLFNISNITAAGQTVTAAGGVIPMARYNMVDNLPNIALPALTAGATISITVVNTTAATNATAVGVIDGETGEA